MQIQYTKWQTQRRSLPDKIFLSTGILVKACSRLNLTWQIRNLAEAAERGEFYFQLNVPKGCRFSPELRQFLKEHKHTKVKRGDR